MSATIKLENKHFPVLLKELISIISPLYGGTFIDCTFGQGGYSKKILEKDLGAKKFINIKIINAKSQYMAKNIGFSIANSPLVKTAIAGEDPNWGRIIMAVGKANVNLNPNKITIKFGNITIIENGKLVNSYNESEAANYMKEEKIDLLVNLNQGKKEFICYTMDLTKKYIEINSDYRT